MKRTICFIFALLTLTLMTSCANGGTDVSGSDSYAPSDPQFAVVENYAIIVEGYDVRPSIGWGKKMFDNYFKEKFTEENGQYIFSGLGFKVSFTDGYVSVITITDNLGCFCRGGVTVGSAKEDVLSAWGEPNEEYDDLIVYYIDSAGQLGDKKDAAAKTLFSLKDGLVKEIVISGEI